MKNLLFRFNNWLMSKMPKESLEEAAYLTRKLGARRAEKRIRERTGKQ